MAKIEIETIVKLYKIFTSKKWNEIDGSEDCLKRFSELFGCLNKVQTELLLELTSRYRWFSYNEYQSTIRRLLLELHSSYLDKIDTVYVFPIIKPKDESKTKSGNTVMYMIDSIKPHIDNLTGIKFKQVNDFKSMSEESLRLKPNEIVILVDDYIGSGDTLESTLNMLSSNRSIENRFVILSVMIQESTKMELDLRKIKNIIGETSKKGISDCYLGGELRKNIKTMTAIEKLIPKIGIYNFGYGKSEGLVSMMKTPNNTFPIFWNDLKKKNKLFKAPFPRY